MAVLIDAENISVHLIDRVFAEAAKHGKPGTRRAYADWGGSQMAGWKTCVNRHALRTVHQFTHVSGKNVSDMALIMDAMDLLHAREHDGFCIVSSGSDFSGLATRIRQEGLRVIGIGEAKTPQAFRDACDQFVQLAELSLVKSAAPPATVTSIPQKGALNKGQLQALQEAIKATADKDGWAELSVLGSHLAKQKKIEPRKHAASLSRLLRALDIAEISDGTTDPGKPQRVRLKATPKQVAAVR